MAKLKVGASMKKSLGCIPKGGINSKRGLVQCKDGLILAAEGALNVAKESLSALGNAKFGGDLQHERMRGEAS